MGNEQYVCTVCGYNMVGYYPDVCPFCGAARENFITAEECSARYRVESTPVNQKVTRLNSVPALGLEHAAFRVKTAGKIVWIDCPSSFDSNLEAPDIITFTHHHFLGASNLYQDHFSSWIRIHKLDAAEDLCRGFYFDETFEHDHMLKGIEAFHINGHTRGFTFYFYGDVLFVCDYVFLRKDGMVFNPYGPGSVTREGGHHLFKLLTDRNVQTVCGFNYVVDYRDWIKAFEILLGQG